MIPTPLHQGQVILTNQKPGTQTLNPTNQSDGRAAGRVWVDLEERRGLQQGPKAKREWLRASFLGCGVFGFTV